LLTVHPAFFGAGFLVPALRVHFADGHSNPALLMEWPGAILDRMRAASKNSRPQGTRRPKCPQCGSTAARPIVYGLPGKDLLQAANRGDVELGGCCIIHNAPAWECPDCSHRW